MWMRRVLTKRTPCITQNSTWRKSPTSRGTLSIFNSQTQIFWKIAALKKLADLKMSKFSAVATSFFLGGHKKEEKCGKRPYIYYIHREWRWEVLKVVTCSWILFFLNNRSIVDFHWRRGREGHKTEVFLWTS